MKLNTNENPYPPPPEVLDAIRSRVGPGLRLYPDPLARAVRERAAALFDLDPEWVLAGNGSDELLSIVVRAFVDPGESVVYPWPTYSLYPLLVAHSGGREIRVPYGRDFMLPVDALASARARLAIVCNPNSPSGTWTELARLAELAGRLGGPLVVDEAYADFAGETAVPLLREKKNVIVVRSLSKSYSLAGLRVGYLLARPELVREFAKLKDSYNLDALAIAGASAALAATGWMRSVAARVAADRERLSAGLTRLGFAVLPSRANFVLARLGEPRAREVFQELRRRKILVRHFDVPGLADSLRITVGTTAEVDRLLAEIEAIVGPQGDTK